MAQIALHRFQFPSDLSQDQKQMTNVLRNTSYPNVTYLP